MWLPQFSFTCRGFHSQALPNSMGKRVRRGSKQEQNKGDNNLEDRISVLPDEILVFILSFLGLKEAAVTSLLSRRWRVLWAFTTRLHFSATETLDNITEMTRELERSRYVKWVNQVLELHKSPTVEEFRVGFDLDKDSKTDVDKWLKFALQRRVQRLEFDLSDGFGVPTYKKKSYIFPYEMFDQAQGTYLKDLASNFSSMRPCWFVGFKSLKDMCLKCVDVTGEVLGYLLSNCPFLECLSVHGSKLLVNLKFAGPLLVLKYLEICNCDNIKSIEICDVNLISLKYAGEKLSLLLDNVPLLADLTISGPICDSLEAFFPQLSCCLSQLETLTLDINDCKEFAEFHVSPALTNLKKLVLTSLASGDRCLLEYTSLIKASPFLRKFVLKVEWMTPSIDKRKIRRAVKFPHQYLEEVELAGYYGRKCEMELVKYFLENAVALKKIVVDPHDQFDKDLPKEIYQIKEQKAALRRAKQQLKGKVPPRIELMIL